MTSIAICRATISECPSVSSTGRVNTHIKITFYGPPLGKQHLPQYAPDRYDLTKDEPLQRILSNPEDIASLHINNVAVDPHTRRPLSMNAKRRLFTPSPRGTHCGHPMTPPDQVIQGYGQIEGHLAVAAMEDGASAYPTPAATDSGPKRLNTNNAKYANKALPPRPANNANGALAQNRALTNKQLPAKPILREKHSPERRGILDATDPISKRISGRYPLIQPGARVTGTAWVRQSTAATSATAKIKNVARAANSPKSRATISNINRAIATPVARDYSLIHPGDRRVTFEQYISMFDEHGHQVNPIDGNKPTPRRINRSIARGYAALSPKGKERAEKALLVPILKGGEINMKEEAIAEIPGLVEATKNDAVVVQTGEDLNLPLAFAENGKDKSFMDDNFDDTLVAKDDEEDHDVANEKDIEAEVENAKDGDISTYEKDIEAEVENAKDGDTSTYEKDIEAEVENAKAAMADLSFQQKLVEAELAEIEKAVTSDNVSEIINPDDEARRSANYGVGPTIRFSKDAHEVIFGHASSVKSVPSAASKNALLVPAAMKTLPVSASIASVASNTSVRKPMTVPGTPQTSSKTGLLGVGIGQKTKLQNQSYNGLALAHHAPDPSSYGAKNKITFNSSSTKPIGVASFDSQRAVANTSPVPRTTASTPTSNTASLKEKSKDRKATDLLAPPKPAITVSKDKDWTRKDTITKATESKDEDLKFSTTSRLARPTAISAAREAAAKAKMQEREHERERKGTMATIKSRISSMMPRKNPPPPPPHPKRTSSLPVKEREKEMKMKMEQAKKMLEEVREAVRLNAPGETGLIGLLEEGVMEFEKIVG